MRVLVRHTAVYSCLSEIHLVEASTSRGLGRLRIMSSSLRGSSRPALTPCHSCYLSRERGVPTERVPHSLCQACIAIQSQSP